jgi:hypothetical protein
MSGMTDASQRAVHTKLEGSVGRWTKGNGTNWATTYDRGGEIFFATISSN